MTPVTEKPLKPLWFHAGSWWILARDGDDWRVYRRSSSGSWTSSSPVLTSNVTTMDAHLHGNGLVTWYGNPQMGRIAYDNGSWVVDVAAVTVPSISNQKNAGGHCVVDSQGRAWGFGGPAGEIRYFVRDSDLSALQGDTLLTDDPPTVEHVSRSVVWDGKVGVLWDNQTVERMRFIWRNDGDTLTTWQTIENASADTPDNADDHGDITPGPDGDLLAVWKTELSGESAPVIRYARRTSAGSWVDETTVFLWVGPSSADEHTRPRVVYDSTEDEVVVLATFNFNGGPIEYRRSPRLNPSFGDVQTAIAGTTNNVTVSHHEVTATSGLLVVDESGEVGVVTAPALPTVMVGFVVRGGEPIEVETSVVRDGTLVPVDA